jgi:hypothetical protein
LRGRSALRIGERVTRASLESPERSAGPPADLATQLAALQAEWVASRAEAAAKLAALEAAVANLGHESTLPRRRLHGNRTERSATSELRLALGDRLAGEAQLQRELKAALDPAREAAGPEPKTPRAPRPAPTGRRNVHVSKLPRVLVELRHEVHEA